MMKNALPILACFLVGGIATAQTSIETPTDVRPDDGSAPRRSFRVQIPQMVFGTGSFLGVYPVEVNSESAAKYGLGDDPHGALLQKVVENTAASRAGLQENDLIVEWNGARVESAAQLRRLINETPVGRKVVIGYIRNGVRLTAGTTLEERPAPELPDIPELPKNFMKENETLEKMFKNGPKLGMIRMEIGNGRMGASLQNITPQLATYFGLSEGSGALVGAVAENSAAAKGGLQVGDVIVAVDGEKVEGPGDVARMISKKEGETELRVIRDKQEQTIHVKLEGPAMNNVFEFNNLEDGIMPDLQRMERRFKLSVPDGEGSLEIFVAPDTPEVPETPSNVDTPEVPDAPAAPNLGEPDLGSYLVPRELREGRSGGEFQVRRIPGTTDEAVARKAALTRADI